MYEKRLPRVVKIIVTKEEKEDLPLQTTDMDGRTYSFPKETKYTEE